MGYYANGSGSIVFTRGLTDEECDRIRDVLTEAFETDGDPSSDMKSILGKGCFDIWNSENYYEDKVEKALDEVSKIVPVESGEISYIGEDGALWRFIFKNGNWKEQNGRVAYDDDNDDGTFGKVSWCRSDIETALHDLGYDTWHASYCKTITLSHSTVDKLNKALNWKDGDPEGDRFGEDDIWTETADFGNGVCIDIKVCGVQYDCPEGCNSAWSEAVLFKDGVEQCCTDPGDDLLGDWELAFDGKVYKVSVEEEPAEEKPGLGLNRVGTIDIPDGKVDVTDPCYDHRVWCRINGVQVTPGTYDCLADIVDGAWGRRVARCIILLEGFGGFYSAAEIGSIGVDAGLAGFFTQKPDFSDDEWQELCNSMFHGTGSYTLKVSLADKAFICDFDGNPGFWTSSGFGDGGYSVYAYYRDGDKNSLPVGLCITFIEEDEEDEDYE